MRKQLYKVGFAALVAAPLFGLFSQNTYAAMPSTFKDANFYNCVEAAFAAEYPNEVIAETGLTNEQLGKIEELKCYGPQETDTTGLELMTSLTTLWLSENQFTSIDVSKNVNLTDLRIGANQLTSIDLSKNVNLTFLSLFYNQLTSIDLSKNINLDFLDLSSNPLISVDLSKDVDPGAFFIPPYTLVDFGITPNEDGDRLVYDLSKIKLLNSEYYTDYAITGKCKIKEGVNIYESDDPQSDYERDDDGALICDNEYISYDAENGLLYVTDLSMTEGYADVAGGDFVWFRLKLNPIEEENPLSPDTGSFVGNSENSSEIVSVFGMSLGALIIGLVLHFNHKRNNLRLE